MGSVELKALKFATYFFEFIGETYRKIIV